MAYARSNRQEALKMIERHCGGGHIGSLGVLVGV